MTNFSNGLANLQASLSNTIRISLDVPPTIGLAEWSNTHARLTKLSAGTNAGLFQAKAFQVGIMDAITDPKVKQVTLYKSARIGYNVILNNAIGYYIAQDPSAMIFVQTRQEDADNYSRRHIAAMLEETPVLKQLVGEVRAKSSTQRIGERIFRNGSSIKFVGSNSAANFRSHTAQIMIFDEVDSYPNNVEGEGSVLVLGKRRVMSEYNTKMILGSTPKIKGQSRIEQSYETSDQREYYVPCPHCAEKQTLQWKYMKWDPVFGDDGKPVLNQKGKEVHDPLSAYFQCQHCPARIEEKYKGWMVDNGEWIASKPFNGHAGFKIWSAYSDLPGAVWSEIVKEFLEAGSDPELLQPWVNTILGETWEEQGKRLDTTDLHRRRTLGNFDIASIPNDVHLLTIGVDVQGNRLEVLIVGWGAKEESYLLHYDTIFGDPTQDQVWDALTQVITDTYVRQDGTRLKIGATCVDSGNGNHTERVYAYCDSVRSLNVYATKGEGTVGRPIWPKQLGRSKIKGYKYAVIGVHAGKSTVYDRLELTEPGQAYVHISNTIEDSFLDSLTREKRVKRVRMGTPYTVFENPSGQRNEGLDCFVMALAAMKSGKWDRKLARMPSAARTEAPGASPEPEPATVAQEVPQRAMTPAPAPPPPPPPPPRPVPPRPMPRPPARPPRINPYTKTAKGLF